ncbi:MAG: hypothetical protein COB53_02325 [Elusimicrobia bacterium]|nr:MAG: hypothetical protein COB53_02325 [Elusimicrobiota bacterium]
MHPYKIRADMRVNDDWRKLVFVAIQNETPEHLALKLAAYLSFWKEELTMEASAKHPALAGSPFRPDLLGTNIEGQVSVWIECGKTATNKLEKVLRKWPDAKIVCFKESEFVGRQFRTTVLDEIPRGERVEVYCWKDGGFKEWIDLLAEKTEIFGEAGGVSFNLVVGESVYVADLVKV